MFAGILQVLETCKVRELEKLSEKLEKLVFASETNAGWFLLYFIFKVNVSALYLIFKAERACITSHVSGMSTRNGLGQNKSGK